MSNPAPGIPSDDFSARWTGKLVANKTGKYRFGAIADDGVRVYLDGKLIAEDWSEHAPATVTGEVTLEAGRSYDIKMEYYESKIGAVAKLVWQPPVVETRAPYAEAVDAARQADTVVLVLGLSSRLEGEEMNVREPVSSVEIDSISTSLHVSRVCLKPLGRPANRLWSCCFQEVHSPSTGPTNTPPQSCRRGIRAKKEELQLRKSSSEITTRPDGCP